MDACWDRLFKEGEGDQRWIKGAFIVKFKRDIKLSILKKFNDWITAGGIRVANV